MIPNNDNLDYTDNNVKSSLASNISSVYMNGKFTHRQKKALSSVVTLVRSFVLLYKREERVEGRRWKF